MTEKTQQDADKTEGPAKDFFFRTRAGRAALAVVLLNLFLAGYSVTSSVVMPSWAVSLLQEIDGGDDTGLLPVIVGPDDASDGVESTICPPATAATPPSPCTTTDTTASTVTDPIEKVFKKEMKDAAESLEGYIGNSLIDGMMTALLLSLNQAELNLIDWWDTFWFYNLLPAMQDMTREISVSYADQVRTLQSSVDSQQMAEAKRARSQQAATARKAFAPSEGAAVVATMVGGQERATAVGQAERQALQNDSLALGANKVGTPAAAGIAATEQAQQDRFEKTFCNPDGNGGQDLCNGSDPKFYNADTQWTKRVYNKLTIDIANTDATVQKKNTDTVAALMDNMVGLPTADPIPLKALASAPAQERFINHRAFLTRFASIRTIPQKIIDWRTPGSQMGQWVKDLRLAAGVPVGQIADNPSYKEVLHAMTIDRFNSGKYAQGMLTDEAAIERENLIMNSLYLMQLRDYYELLERTALTLAVQVSILADQVAVPAVHPLQPQ